MVYVDRRGLFMNGKAEAASGAPTCEKRVNTFSFCGTGGSFFVKVGRSSKFRPHYFKRKCSALHKKT